MSKKKHKILIYLLLLLIIFEGCSEENNLEYQNTTTAAPADIQTGVTEIHWWNESVFYLVFVRSFYDSNGDGIGDINGVIERLDYLNDGNPETDIDLGVTALWLMPIQPSTSYHGYDVTDYYGINPDYGTLEDFRRLIVEAHQRGIRIVMDLVLNHTSNRHPFFIASENLNSEYRDFYIWSETDPGFHGPWGEDVWHSGHLGGYYYGIFNAEMPDLNYTNPAVTAEIENASRFWLNDVGVDGFRLDAARHLIEDGQIQANSDSTHNWYADFHTFLETINPEVMTVGEVWDCTALAAEYAQGDEFNLVFNFDLADALINGAASRNASRIISVLRNDLPLFSNGLTMATFLTNHDMTRAMTETSGSTEKMKMAATLLLTIPGTPFIYYGEEIGMTGEKPDPNLRTPMQWDASENGGFTSGTPWEPLQSNFQTVNVEAQTNDESSLLSHYRDLIQLRQTHSALRIGNFIPIETGSNRVFAAIRYDSEEIILILINMGNEPLTDLSLTLFDGPLQGSYSIISLLGNITLETLNSSDSGGFSLIEQSINIPANENAIFQLVPIE